MEFKKTIGYTVFLFFKNWKTAATMFFFDILFAVSLFAFAKLFDTLFEHNETLFVGTFYGHLLLFVYLMLIIFTHSFFKYCSFDCFQEQEKTKFTFEKLGIFYLWNLIMYGILGFLGGSLYLFLSISLIDVLKTPAMVIVALFGVGGGYLFAQTSHVIFFENIFKGKEQGLKEIPKKVWESLTIKRIASLIGWNMGFVIFFFIIYFVLYLGIVQVAEKATQDTRAMMLFFILNVLVFIFLVIFSYGILFWNRIYIFLIYSVREKKEKIIS